jgi:hypothetical protein
LFPVTDHRVSRSVNVDWPNSARQQHLLLATGAIAFWRVVGC